MKIMDTFFAVISKKTVKQFILKMQGFLDSLQEIKNLNNRST